MNPTKIRTMTGILWLVISSSLALQGCLVVAGAGAGAGAVAYVRGELQTTYPAPLERTWEAALGALKDLQIPVHNAKKDALGGIIEATRADGSKVTLALETVGTNTTSVKIRVGLFGSEDASKAIHRKIAERLGMKAG